MALNFPNSPTNGQLYTDSASGNRWVWDSGNTCWVSTSTFTQTITVASSAPGSPVTGQLWWNKDYGRLLVYYTDDNTSQWVDASPSDYTSQLAYGQANAAYTAANTALQNTNVTLAGNLTVTGNVVANKQVVVTYTPSTSVNAAITAAAANSQGGTGYADFLKATNLSGGTNPHKTFRLNSTGGIEVINSAYNSIIMSLTDGGSFAVGSRGISSSSMPAGCILQVQQAFYSAATTLASGTFTDYPGLSITITPTSSTSKFFLMYHLQMTLYGTTIMSRFLRNSTAVGVGDAAGSRNQSTTGWLFPSGDTNHQACPMVGFYLDSPATASAITYKVQAKTQTSGTAYINYGASNADNSDWAHRSTSSFTVFEVAV